MRSARLFATLVLAAGLVGCASGGLGGSGQGDQAAELTAARQRAVMAEVEVRRLRERVAELEQRLAAAPVAPAVPADAVTEAEEPFVEPGPIELPGRADVEESELEVPPVRPAQPVDSAPPPVAAPPPTEAPAAGAPAADAQALYDQGYAFFHQKRYADAESRFRHFLDLYPRHPLADNAQFWIGESRYARGDFASALAAFSATVEDYPEGNKVADAMLQAGKCLESMGQTAEAIATYEAIEERFPGTVVASTAASRLAALRGH